MIKSTVAPPGRTLPASQENSARHKEITTKRRGELAELAFVYKAASLGFGVAKPYGDSERFDFILISRNWPSGEQLWRVQIKSTTSMLNGLYRINAHRRTNGRVIAYQPSEIDFLIARIIPEDSWFVFPIHDVDDRTSLLLRPLDRPRCGPAHTPAGGLFDPYREAWHLLRSP